LLRSGPSGRLVIHPARFAAFPWFNADPHGHNAGWQLQFTVGKDQVVNRDLNNASGSFCGVYASNPCNTVHSANSVAPLPMLMGKMALATLNYKFNNWCQFGFEQSIYATRMMDHLTCTQSLELRPTNGKITAPSSGRSLRSRPTYTASGQTGPLVVSDEELKWPVRIEGYWLPMNGDGLHSVIARR